MSRNGMNTKGIENKDNSFRRKIGAIVFKGVNGTHVHRPLNQALGSEQRLA